MALKCTGKTSHKIYLFEFGLVVCGCHTFQVSGSNEAFLPMRYDVMPYQLKVKGFCVLFKGLASHNSVMPCVCILPTYYTCQL